MTEAAAKKFAKECRLHFLDHEKNGMNYPERYVHGLCRHRDEAERHPDPPPPGEFDLPIYIEWLPEPFAAKEPEDSEMRKTFREAVKEAVRWGSLFPVIEARIKALEESAYWLTQYAGLRAYCDVREEKDDEQADREYVSRHEKFAEALDALAPFIEEPPANTGSSPKHKTGTAKQPTKRSRRGIGGRPEKFTMKFIREVVAARERDEKQAAKARMPLPSKAEWLSDYCSAKGIDLRKQFPPATPGEEWRLRANRFWKAATKRLREAETNRH